MVPSESLLVEPEKDVAQPIAATTISSSGDEAQASSSLPSTSSSISAPTPTPSNFTAITPPRARRQPPLSQSAWNTLREQLPGSDLSRAISTTPSNVVAPAAPSSTSRAPEAEETRRILPLPHHRPMPLPGGPSDIFSRTARAASTSPPRPTYVHGRSNLGIPPSHRLPLILPTPTASSGAGNDQSLPSIASRLPATMVPVPGSTLAALLADILGLTGRGAQLEQHRQRARAAAPTAPAMPTASPSPASSNSSAAPSTTTSASPPRPALARDTAVPPPIPFGLPDLSMLGGTSIVVQGAMISRLLSPQGRASAEAQEASAAQSATEAAPPSTQASNSADDIPANPLSSDAPPPGDGFPLDANVEHGNEAQGRTTLGVGGQAAMLTRLLSIAAAATAASLMAGTTTGAGVPENSTPAATYNSQGTQTTTDGPLNPADGPLLWQSEPRRAPGLLQTARSLLTDPLRSLRGRSSASNLFSSISSLLRPSGPSTASLSSQEASQPLQTTPPSPEQVVDVEQQRRADDSEAMQVDSDLGPGIRMVGHLGRSETTDGSGDSSNGQAAQQASRNRPAADRRDISLSEMIQEAIRSEGFQRVANEPGEGQATSGAAETPTTPPPTTQPEAVSSPPADISAHLRNILAAVRENRLGTGSQGSFERWLSELGGDLDAAVRSLISESRSTEASADQAVAEAVTERRAADIASEQLAFFRLYRFDQYQADTSNGLRSRLIPCVLVGVRSLSAESTVTPQSVAAVLRNARQAHEAADHPERQATPAAQSQGGPTNGSQQSAQPGSDDASATPATGTVTASGDTTGSTPASDDPASASRFLLFVSGGHYSPSHPLLAMPTSIVTRDVMMLIEILANMNSAQGRSATSTVSKEELEKSDLDIRKWSEIKGRAVGTDAKEGEVKTTEVPVQQPGEEAVRTETKTVLALRAGDSCGICLEDWQDSDDVRILSCKHVYHQGCVDQWLLQSSNTCPMCRTTAVKRGAAAARSPASGSQESTSAVSPAL